MSPLPLPPPKWVRRGCLGRSACVFPRQLNCHLPWGKQKPWPSTGGSSFRFAPCHSTTDAIKSPERADLSLFMLTLCNQVLDKARSYTCHSWTELERWRELCALEFSLETQLQVLVHTYWKVTTVKWHVWDFSCENSFKVVKSEYRYYDSITFPVQPVGSSLPIFKFSFIMMIMIMIMTFSIYKDVSPFRWTHFKCFEMPSTIHC